MKTKWETLEQGEQFKSKGILHPKMKTRSFTRI